MKDFLHIDLEELLSSLSLVLDIAENRSFEHSRRTAYIGTTIARELKLSEDLVGDIYYSGFIHDIGLAGQLAKYNIVDIHKDKSLKKEHCELGGNVIRYLPLGKNVHDFVLYHHEEWDGNGAFGLKENEIPLGAQIINLADSFDINFSTRINEEGIIDTVRHWISSIRGTSVNPMLIDCFEYIIGRDSFWFDLRFHNLTQVLNTVRPNKTTKLDMVGLKNVARAFGTLIDKKSKFTYEHSRGIAKITESIAKQMNYDSYTINKLEVAAYLHDIGKMVVPNTILEKPKKLTHKEFETIKSHPYYTKLILKQVRGLEDIAEWAGNHHEKLNGRGYPQKLDHKTLSNEDQVIAVADIYQALTEDRPYRRGMMHTEAMEVLRSMVKNGFVSGEIVNVLDKVNSLEELSL